MMSRDKGFVTRRTASCLILAGEIFHSSHTHLLSRTSLAFLSFEIKMLYLCIAFGYSLQQGTAYVQNIAGIFLVVPMCVLGVFKINKHTWAPGFVLIGLYFDH